MKHGYAIFFSVVFAALFLAGCTSYQTLPPMPEYKPLTKTFNTTAPLTLYPYETEWLNPLIRKEFHRNGYANLLGVLPDRLTDSTRTKVVIPLDFKQEIIAQPNGYVLDSRIIVSVRRPIVQEKGLMKYSGKVRTFQARSRLLMREKKAGQELLAAEAKHLLDNLFLIEEFREALQ